MSEDENQVPRPELTGDERLASLHDMVSAATVAPSVLDPIMPYGQVRGTLMMMRGDTAVELIRKGGVTEDDAQDIVEIAPPTLRQWAALWEHGATPPQFRSFARWLSNEIGRRNVEVNQMTVAMDEQRELLHRSRKALSRISKRSSRMKEELDAND